MHSHRLRNTHVNETTDIGSCANNARTMHARCISKSHREGLRYFAVRPNSESSAKADKVKEPPMAATMDGSEYRLSNTPIGRREVVKRDGIIIRNPVRPENHGPSSPSTAGVFPLGHRSCRVKYSDLKMAIDDFGG
mgnify:FL=1